MSSAKRKAFLLRIAPDLWQALEAWSDEDMRSVNGQIEFLLREAVRRRRRAAAGAAAQPEGDGHC